MDEETIHNRRWVILGVLVLCLLVVILDNTILNVALKTIQADLNASQSEMQWAVDSYALVFAGLLITWGVLGDRLGAQADAAVRHARCSARRRRCARSPDSSTQLILFRALMGIGAAAVQPQTLSIIQNVFEPQERAKAIGIWAGASGMAIALGPITGGLLLKYFWWGSIFLVNVPIVIVGSSRSSSWCPSRRTRTRAGSTRPACCCRSSRWSCSSTASSRAATPTTGCSGTPSARSSLGVALLALFVWTAAPQQRTRRSTSACSATGTSAPARSRSRWRSSRCRARRSTSPTSCRRCAATRRCSPASR